MTRLDVLFDATDDRPSLDLPDDLRAAYGDLRLDEDCVYANFVSSIDGVVALRDVPKSSMVIGGGNDADRFVLSLLRATADAVVIGAETYRQHKGPWTADRAFPDAAWAFAELRERLGTAPEPRLVVVTTSGEIGPPRDYLRGALIVTTPEARPVLHPHVAAGADVAPIATDDGVDPRVLVEYLRDRNHRRILTEGGPGLMGNLLRARVVDELFLTSAPVVLGHGPNTVTLAGGADLTADPVRAGRLLSARRSGEYLFLRYSFERE